MGAHSGKERKPLSMGRYQLARAIRMTRIPESYRQREQLTKVGASSQKRIYQLGFKEKAVERAVTDVH